MTAVRKLWSYTQPRLGPVLIGLDRDPYVAIPCCACGKASDGTAFRLLHLGPDTHQAMHKALAQRPFLSRVAPIHDTCAQLRTETQVIALAIDTLRELITPSRP